MNYDTIDNLIPAELVAIVLGKKSVDDECQRIADLVINDSWANGAEIARENGTAALKRIDRINGAIELGRRTMEARATRKADIVSCKDDVVALLGPRVSGLQVEQFYCLCLNTKNKLKQIVEISTGSLNASIVHPRELFRRAVELSSASIIIVHNHPSGDPTPSGADIQLTRRLCKAGEVLGIEVLDHVVIGGDTHSSLREMGLM